VANAISSSSSAARPLHENNVLINPAESGVHLATIRDILSDAELAEHGIITAESSRIGDEPPPVPPAVHAVRIEDLAHGLMALAVTDHGFLASRDQPWHLPLD